MYFLLTESFLRQQDHRARLDAAVCRARHVPCRMGGVEERLAARSPACAGAAQHRPDSVVDRKFADGNSAVSEKLL